MGPGRMLLTGRLDVFAIIIIIVLPSSHHVLRPHVHNNNTCAKYRFLHVCRRHTYNIICSHCAINIYIYMLQIFLCHPLSLVFLYFSPSNPVRARAQPEQIFSPSADGRARIVSVPRIYIYIIFVLKNKQLAFIVRFQCNTIQQSPYIRILCVTVLVVVGGHCCAAV